MNSDYDHDGELKMSHRGRWLLNGDELTSGDCFEVWIQGYWIRVVIEHHGTQYQVYPRTINLHQGLRARFLGEYTD